jgi:hypothetical protein
MFYIDPKTNLITLARVVETTPPATAIADVYLDLKTDAGGNAAESLTLPKGVGVQFVDDWNVTGAPPPRNDDGYVGFNTYNGHDAANRTLAAYGGVILFDSHGQLVSRTYAFRTDSISIPANPMAKLFFMKTDGTFVSSIDSVVPVIAAATMLKSQFAFVLFDVDAFRNQFTDADPQVDPSLGSYNSSGPEGLEETWLDQNALPLLINRFNGTLVKGE